MRASRDGFGSIVGGTQTTTAGATPGLPTAAFGPAFDAVDGPLELRICGTNAVAANGALRLRDGPGGPPGLRLTGDFVSVAAVPEPASARLLGAGLPALERLARRRAV